MVIGSLSLCQNLKSCKYLVNARYFRTVSRCFQNTSNEISQNEIVSEKRGFAKSFEKQSQILQEEPVIHQTFASLLRNSKLIDVSKITLT